MKLDLYVISSKQTNVRIKKVSELCEKISGLYDTKITFISEHEPEDITNEIMKASVVIEKLNNELYDSLLRNLTPKHVSNGFKHHDALKRIASNTRAGAYSIVLEDDPLIVESFDIDFDKLLKDIPSCWSMIMLGLPGKAQGFQPLTDVYKALPVCNAYIIKPSIASKLANTFLPLRYVTNIHLSYSLQAFGIVPLLYSPQLFIDGSKYGIYVSTLTPNNELLFNKDYVQARKQMNDKCFKEALFTIQSSAVKHHPDFLHLKGMCEVEVHGKEVAKKTFEEALRIYDENNAITNNESTYLTNYISLFRDDSVDT